MIVTGKVLIEAKNAETAQTTQYTATGKVAVIDRFTATNTGGSATTISVNLVPPAGAVSTGNRVVSLRTLGPGETYVFPELSGHVIADGGFISTLAGATGVTIRASGREIV